MGVYCYRKDDGSLVELTMDVMEMIERQDSAGRITLDDGTTAVRDYTAEHKCRTAASDRWPMACEASAVFPDQVAETQAYLAKRGVKTDFTKDGRPIYRSRGHRRAALKARGFFDRNGGYSDP